MTNTTKVIIAFSAVVLVGCGVIGYGLYRRAGGADLREAKRTRARVAATMSLQEFAWESVARQDKLLAEAGDAAVDMKSGGASEDAEAGEALRRWKVGCTDLQAQIAKITDELAALAKSMALVFPLDPNEQLAPELVTGLAAAVGKVRDADRWATTVEVGRERARVDITAVVADDLHKLAVRANEVEAELARRDSAYAAFVERTRWALRGGAGSVAAGWRIRRWRAAVARDPAKKKTVTELAEVLAAVPTRRRDRDRAAGELDAVVTELAQVSSRGAVVRLAGRFNTAVVTAHPYPSLRPRIDKAQRALAAAEERTAAPTPMSPSEYQKRQKWRGTIEIGRKVIEMAKIAPDDSDAELARETKWGQIQTHLGELAKVDNNYAEALGKLLVVWHSQVGPSSAPRTPLGPPRFLMPPWMRLKSYNKRLMDAIAVLTRIRSIAKEATDPDASKSSLRRTTSLASQAKAKAMEQLGTWIGVLEKQMSDVAVISKKNAP